MAIGMVDQEGRIFHEQRIAAPHLAGHDGRLFELALVFERPSAFVPADPVQEFVEVMHPSPLTVADHIQPGLLLQADGEDHHFVHQPIVLIQRHGIAPVNKIADKLRPRQRTDDLGEEWRQGLGANRFHVTSFGVQFAVASPLSPIACAASSPTPP